MRAVQDACLEQVIIQVGHRIAAWRRHETVVALCDSSAHVRAQEHADMSSKHGLVEPGYVELGQQVGKFCEPYGEIFGVGPVDKDPTWIAYCSRRGILIVAVANACPCDGARESSGGGRYGEANTCESMCFTVKTRCFRSNGMSRTQDDANRGRKLCARDVMMMITRTAGVRRLS
jgi:hypothetical protein